MIRSPALTAIATCALTALLATHGQIGGSTCQAFSVGGTTGVNRVNANANINMHSQMKMSLADQGAAVELKKDNFGIYDLASKEDHL